MIDKENPDVSMSAKRALEEARCSNEQVLSSVSTIYGEREFYVQFSLTNPSASACVVTDIKLENVLKTQHCVLTDFVQFEMQPKQTYILVQKVKVVSENKETRPEQDEICAIEVTCDTIPISVQL